MSIHGVLGESTSYPQTYDKSVLFAISRSLGRDEIWAECGVAASALCQGVDVWQAFELSWLNMQGISQVAMARIFIPADSPNIVESKSLKLYLNSLNFTRFDDMAVLRATIESDLSACVGAAVSVEISVLDGGDFHVAMPMGECIDHALDGTDVDIALTEDIDATPLHSPNGGKLITHRIYSNLLRSNCPVTNQPDWGTVAVSITTDKQFEYGKFLKYILSFRKHNGFHEQCVERIFADLMIHFAPSSLMVQANYTRRGGIDINPVRVFNHDLPKVCRQVRQ